MSWNFILLIFIINASDESSLYSRINYVHSPDGNFSAECPGIIKRCTQGLARTRIAEWCQRPGADTEETDVT